MELEMNANIVTEVSLPADQNVLVEEQKQGEEETKTLSPASTGKGSRISLDSEEERCLMKAGRGDRTILC